MSVIVPISWCLDFDRSRLGALERRFESLVYVFASDEGTSEPDKIVTTEDELEGFYIVKSIVREAVDPNRVFMRDTQSYCGILIDDNNRKPICRLHFNGAQKYLGLLDAEKAVTRHPISDVNEVYKHADSILEAVRRFCGESKNTSAGDS